jgi:hypothetical protein
VSRLRLACGARLGATQIYGFWHFEPVQSGSSLWQRMDFSRWKCEAILRSVKAGYKLRCRRGCLKQAERQKSHACGDDECCVLCGILHEIFSCLGRVCVAKQQTPSVPSRATFDAEFHHVKKASATALHVSVFAGASIFAGAPADRSADKRRS